MWTLVFGSNEMNEREQFEETCISLKPKEWHAFAIARLLWSNRGGEKYYKTIQGSGRREHFGSKVLTLKFKHRIIETELCFNHQYLF